MQFNSIKDRTAFFPCSLREAGVFVASSPSVFARLLRPASSRPASLGPMCTAAWATVAWAPPKCVQEKPWSERLQQQQQATRESGRTIIFLAGIPLLFGFLFVHQGHHQLNTPWQRPPPPGSWTTLHMGKWGWRSPSVQWPIPSSIAKNKGFCKNSGQINKTLFFYLFAVFFRLLLLC